MDQTLDLIETLTSQDISREELPTVLTKLHQYDQRMYRESIFATIASAGLDEAISREPSKAAAKR